MSNNKEVVVIPSSTISLMACPRPFSVQRIERALPEGSTIADMLRAIGLNPDPLFARVFIDDRLILKAEWEWAIPKADQLVTVRVIPTGGAGGGKDALRIVAMIAVMAAAIYTANGALAGAAGAIGGGGAWGGATAAGFGVGGTGSALAGLGVSIIGTLAVGALIPPAKPKLQDLSRLNLSPALSLTGSSNQLAPYAPILRIYGRYRLYPPLAARPYTETVGGNQYLRLLFCCGYGPLVLSEMKIGQAPLAQFQEVETEIRYGYQDDAPITLFPDDVYEEALSIVMESTVWQQRTTQQSAREVVVEWSFPSGLYGVVASGGAKGQLQPALVIFEVEYRAVGDVTWIPIETDAPPIVEESVETGWTLPSGNNNIVLTSPGISGQPYQVVIRPSVEVPEGAAVWFTETALFVLYASGTTANQIIQAINVAASVLISQGTGYFLAANAVGSTGEGEVTESFVGEVPRIVPDPYPLTYTAKSVTPTAYHTRFLTPDPTKQYEVRSRVFKQITADVAMQNLTVWSALRTIQTAQPVKKPGLCLVGMRIRATDQLNGTLDQFNLIAESILPDWTGTAWLERPTRNPASIYRAILQGAANARPVPDSRVDLTRLAQFHESCTAQGWRFDANIDYRTTVFELCRDVLAAGRASVHRPDGLFSVVEDLQQDIPKQLFTPRNSWGFKGSRLFSSLPHALKVRFVNPEKDWQQDERIVYADGYSEVNATQFEAFELTGVTDPEQAWKLARYHLAVATLRPETYELNADVEHLVCNRGDLVLVQHDVPLFGLLSGRITGVTTDGLGRTTAITLDEPCTMQAGDRYGVRIRLQDNTYVQREVLNVPGTHTTLTLLSPI